MHALTSKFLQTVAQNLPDVQDNVMQYWVDHIPNLQKVLAPLANIPIPPGTVLLNKLLLSTVVPGEIGKIAVDLQGNCWCPAYRTSKVVRITPKGEATAFDVGANYPEVIDVAPDGFVWAGGGQCSLMRIDPTTGAVVARFQAGTGIVRVRVDPATGDVWTTDRGTNKVYRVTNNQTVQSYNAGTLPYHIAFDGLGNVWATNQDSPHLTKIAAANKATGQSELINLPSPCMYLAADKRGNVCVSGSNIGSTVGNGSIYRIDATGNLRTYKFDSDSPLGVAVDSKDNFWVARAGSAYKMDPAGNLGSPIAIGSVAPTQHHLYVDGNDSVWVAFWDGTTKRGLGRITPAGLFEGPFVSGIMRNLAIRDGRIWALDEDVGNESVVLLSC